MKHTEEPWRRAFYAAVFCLRIIGRCILLAASLLIFATGRGLTIKGRGRPKVKKNECMFEKKLGKVFKTRYYIYYKQQ
ncbi:hypothetical protein A8L34_01630 [Bacillus sp. FJAT-27264]|nr:hypothetical protein A8L34_01630 [Bacillus sp. FJAT-27264]